MLETTAKPSERDSAESPNPSNSLPYTKAGTVKENPSWTGVANTLETALTGAFDREVTFIKDEFRASLRKAKARLMEALQKEIRRMVDKALTEEIGLETGPTSFKPAAPEPEDTPLLTFMKYAAPISASVTQEDANKKGALEDISPTAPKLPASEQVARPANEASRSIIEAPVPQSRVTTTKLQPIAQEPNNPQLPPFIGKVATAVDGSQMPKPAENSLVTPAQDEDFFEGVVKLTLNSHSTARQMVSFVGELCENPAFRLLRMEGNGSSNAPDVWLALREPMDLKRALKKMRQVDVIGPPYDESSIGGVRSLNVTLSLDDYKHEPNN